MGKLEDIINEAKERLRDYLEAEGIEVTPNGKFGCPNKAAHTHGDSNKSANIAIGKRSDGYPSWLCYRCQTGGDTLAMASFLYGLPEEGEGFIHETLAHVCEKLGIDLNAAFRSGEKVILDPRIARSAVARKYVKEHPLPLDVLTGSEYRRNYNKELAASILAKYPMALCDFDYDPKAEDRNLLLSCAKKGSILIPILEKNIIKGFQACNKTGTDPKYRNTTKDEEEGVTYPPIINLDSGIRSAVKTDEPLFVFEGAFNTLAAVGSDIPSSIGTLGTAHHKQIRTYLVGRGITEVVICMDKDDAGRESAVALCKELKSLGITNSIYLPDNEELDYDEEFSQRGSELVVRLKDPSNRIDLIEFMCKYKMDYLSRTDISMISIYERLLTDIAKYGHDLMAKRYAEAIIDTFPDISHSEGDILIRITQVLRDSKSPTMNKIDILVTEMSTEVLKNQTIESKKEIVNRLSTNITNLIDMSSMSLKALAARQINEVLTPPSDDEQIIYKTGYKNIDESANGVPSILLTNSMLICLAGKPGHGKSLFARGIALNIAENDSDNTVVVYFSEDDNLARTVGLILSSMSGISFEDIVRDRKRLEPLLEEAKARLRAIYGKSLLIYDKATTPYLSSALGVIDNIIAEYKGKRIFCIMDSIYNFIEIARATANEKRASVERVIDILKERTATGNVTILPTLEVNKNVYGRITLKNLKETGTIEFRADVILATYNSYKEIGPDSKMFLGGQSGRDDTATQYPIIEVHSLKTKVGKGMDTYFFKLDGPTEELDPIIVDSEYKLAKALYETDRGKKYGGQQGTSQDEPEM